MGATMRRNKDRLYVGLYVRRGALRMAGGENRYHWALLRGPKVEDENTLLTKYHATESPGSSESGGSESGGSDSSASSPTELSSATSSSSASWTYAEQTMPTYDLMLLARVLIGKVRNPSRLETILRGVPVPLAALTDKDRLNQPPGWNCVGWVQSALEALAADAGGAMGKSSNLDWTAVRDASLEYVEQKATEHRYDGLAPVGQFDLAKPATFDLVLGQEVAP
ncbi:hypothetical protein HMPREF1624_05231 [Sporothrix schenckii ATCC 58251]|uniref:Uncharacterized protein n=1 Tax=Sporothrix schenckii (strain ATCC 58251 / de Perez 2211183) TaxID=1391915 RepID=U7PS91_SPOS1|nr:hypothetical protein HMPREF1624_05231 [Sporothrix schenckii ATCC 58251]